MIHSRVGARLFKRTQRSYVFHNRDLFHVTLRISANGTCMRLGIFFCLDISAPYADKERIGNSGNALCKRSSEFGGLAKHVKNKPCGLPRAYARAFCEQLNKALNWSGIHMVASGLVPAAPL